MSEKIRDSKAMTSIAGMGVKQEVPDNSVESPTESTSSFNLRTANCGTKLTNNAHCISNLEKELCYDCIFIYTLSVIMQ